MALARAVLKGVIVNYLDQLDQAAEYEADLLELAARARRAGNVEEAKSLERQAAAIRRAFEEV